MTCLPPVFISNVLEFSFAQLEAKVGSFDQRSIIVYGNAEGHTQESVRNETDLAHCVTCLHDDCR